MSKPPEDLRAATIDLILEVSKPTTEKSYPGQKLKRAKAAADDILRLCEAAVLACAPTEADAVEVASDEDERRGFFTAKLAYLEGVDKYQANIHSVFGGTTK